MQVPRYWRMKQQLYRLQGYRQSTGEITLDNRSETKQIDTLVTHQPIAKQRSKLQTVA